ncbi:uncharacterized protein VTP21DRAFT_6694 [Calcarisporiella thermophila]|uniref:uncharacterized protein n=1 Tax=Calcarisporiella thermophila TaxID=911321 RepID=UPI0037443830
MRLSPSKSSSPARHSFPRHPIRITPIHSTTSFPLTPTSLIPSNASHSHSRRPLGLSRSLRTQAQSHKADIFSVDRRWTERNRIARRLFDDPRTPTRRPASTSQKPPKAEESGDEEGAGWTAPPSPSPRSNIVRNDSQSLLKALQRAAKDESGSLGVMLPLPHLDGDEGEKRRRKELGDMSPQTPTRRVRHCLGYE